MELRGGSGETEHSHAVMDETIAYLHDFLAKQDEPFDVSSMLEILARSRLIITCEI